MEQSLYQQDQLGNPQVGQQQMMLCPVRLVYENPLLMQPGDQMQQNQTIFINQQNQPPWARPVQNQVIYFQQLPNNIMQMQQNVDPNLYVQQNYMNYQHLMPQQIIQSPQEQIRFPIQVPNIVHPNIIQNVQPNVHNTDERALGTVIPNYVHMQSNMNSNTPNPNHNQMNMINNRTIQHNQNAQQNLNQNLVTVTETTPQMLNLNQGVTQVIPRVMDTQKQAVFKNVGSQLNPQYVMIRPQVPQMMNQIQTVQNVQNVPQIAQTFVPNVRSSTPKVTQTVTNSATSIQPPTVNPRPNIQVPGERLQAPNANAPRPSNSGATVSYTAVRNGQAYTYRALQPKQQSRHIPNLLPMAAQTQTVMQRPSNPINTMEPVQNKNPTEPVSTLKHVKNELSQVILNRKRKSESPDEVQKKIPATATSIVYGNMIVTARPQENIVKNVPSTNDFGVNTSPVHKTEEKPIKNRSTTQQINPMESIENMIKKELNIRSAQQFNKANPSNVALSRSPVQKMEYKPLVNQPPVLQINPMQSADNIIKQFNIKKEVVDIQQPSNTPDNSDTGNDNMRDAIQTEKDKLVRNTVFTQARGRFFSDKNDPGEDMNSKPEVIIVIKNSGSPKKDESVQTDNNANGKANIEKVETKTEEALKTSELTTKLDETVTSKESVVKTNEAVVSNEPVKKLSKTALDTKDMGTTTDDIKTKANNSALLKTAVPVTLKESLSKRTELNDNSNETYVKPSKRKLNTTETNINSHKQILSTNDTSIKQNAKTNETFLKPKEPNTKLSEKSAKDPNDSTKDKKGFKNLSINDMKGKEIRIVDGSVVKEDRDRILTHVLDGYVIQESSVPFAIRKPLKEKTILANTPSEVDQNHDVKQELMNSIKDNIVTRDNTERDDIAKDSAEKDKLLELSSLNITEENSEETVQENVESIDENVNPFGRLKAPMVKSWTIEELSSHLSKYDWSETISIFQDHEIDGESLFLVSKTQLMTIGVSETHADVICEFVKT